MTLNKQLLEDLKKFNLLSEKNGLQATQQNFQEFVNYLSKIYNEKQLYEEIFHSTPCTISIINSDLTYNKVNNFLANLHKKEASWFEGIEIGSLSVDSTLKTFLTSFFKEDKITDTFYLESIVDNQKKYHYILAKKMNEQGLAVVIGVDVTQIKMMEDESFFNSKLKELGELSASIVHEINNPLSVISSSNELIFMDAQDAKLESIEDMSKNITNSIQNIGKIIKSLKNFMYNRTEFIKFPIEDLITQTEIMTIGKLKKKKVSLTVEYSVAKDLPLFANDVQLTQVLVNLINNAADAVSDLSEKWVKLKISQENNLLKIAVIDSGKGIPEEVASKIFNKFYSTKAQGEGTGLGLSIVSKIIENHKGKISLISGNNTEFEIQLPIK